MNLTGLTTNLAGSIVPIIDKDYDDICSNSCRSSTESGYCGPDAAGG